MTADAPQTAARDVPLPATIAACHAMIGELLAQLNRANGRIAKMEHQLEQLLRRLYGRSAERLDPNQLVLFADLLKQLGPEAAPAPEPPAPPPAALGPLYDLMIREVLASKVIHTDDTPVDVLDRNLPETRVGRFWVYVGDRDHPYDTFIYTANRSRDGPMALLAGWGKDGRRFLQADAFGGYDGLYRGEAGGCVTEVACWSHARRKFYEARTSDSATATQALAYIRLLYDIEDEATQQFQRLGEGDGARPGGAAPSEVRPLSAIRLELRQAKAVPILAQFKTWLESLLPGGPACEADAHRRPPDAPPGGTAAGKVEAGQRLILSRLTTPNSRS